MEGGIIVFPRKKRVKNPAGSDQPAGISGIFPFEIKIPEKFFEKIRKEPKRTSRSNEWINYKKMSGN